MEISLVDGFQPCGELASARSTYRDYQSDLLLKLPQNDHYIEIRKCNTNHSRWKLEVKILSSLFIHI